MNFLRFFAKMTSYISEMKKIKIYENLAPISQI